MFCPYGSITNIQSIGINPKDIKERDVCAATDDNKVCTSLVLESFKTDLIKQLDEKKAKDPKTAVNDHSYGFELKNIFADYDKV